MGAEALWFFGGAVTYSLLSRVIKAGQLVKLSIEIGVSLLVLISYMYDDILAALESKYKKMEKDTKDEDIELLKEVDQAALDVWCHGIIIKFKGLLPSQVQSVFTFHDWAGAMAFLQKHIKRL